MEYEINFPNCPSIEIERDATRYGLSAIGNPIELHHFAGGSVAEFVANEIWRNEWCASGGQASVSAILGLLREVGGNNRPYRRAVLQEALRQLEENRLPPYWIRHIDTPKQYKDHPRYVGFFVCESEPQISEINYG